LAARHHSVEEAEGRLDNLLLRGVVRRRWLAATSMHALLPALVFVTATARPSGRARDRGRTIEEAA
jgi:hypothetical protein